MATTPVFLPRKSHGQRSLAGYSLLGRKESDTTEHVRACVCVCVCVCVHQRSQILPYANCYYLVAKLSDSFETPWTVAHLATLSMGFSRHEYCSGLPFPPPGNLSNPGIELTSPPLAAGFFTTEPPGEKKEQKSRRD